MEGTSVHPYWNLSWRLFGRVLAFLLIPWGLSLVNRNVSRGKSALESTWWLISGKWMAEHPGLGRAFVTSLEQVIAAVVISVAIALLVRAAASWLRDAQWAGFAFRWTLFPFLLAPIVAVAVLWSESAGFGNILISALLISLYPAGVSALASVRSKEIWETVSLDFHSLSNAIGGLIVTESVFGIDGLGSRFITGLKAARWDDVFWTTFMIGAVVLVLHVLGDLSSVRVDFSRAKSRGQTDEPSSNSAVPTWASVGVGAAALLAIALLKNNWAVAAMKTSGAFLILSPLLFAPAVGWGVLTGELRHKGGKARETLAGILSWPLYLFFALPGFFWVFAALAASSGSRDVLGAIAIFYLLPRLAAVSSEAWGKRPHRSGSKIYGWQHGAIMLIALMAWTAGTGVFAISVPGFMGFGLPDVEPELGRMIAKAMQSGGWLAPTLALVYVPFIWNSIADSVIHLIKVDERKQWIW